MTGPVDILVVGGGPAGIACAATAARLGLHVVLAEQSALGGELNTVSWVEARTGARVSGPDLAAEMMDDLLDSGADVVYDTVSGVERTDDGWRIDTASGDPIRARALVLATGTEIALDDVPGAPAAHGRGLSLCASCDAPLFAGKTVAVLGSGRDAAAEARDLLPYAASVTMVLDDERPTPTVAGAASVSVRRVLEVVGAPVEAVVVEGLTGQRARIEVEGVFLAGPRRPRSGLVDQMGGSDAIGRGGDLIAIGDLCTDSERTVRSAVADGTAAARRIHARLVNSGVRA